jgi:hypothetical protein
MPRGGALWALVLASALVGEGTSAVTFGRTVLQRVFHGAGSARGPHDECSTSDVAWAHDLNRDGIENDLLVGCADEDLVTLRRVDSSRWWTEVQWNIRGIDFPFNVTSPSGFGTAIASISSNTIVVGAPLAATHGAVFVARLNFTAKAVLVAVALQHGTQGLDLQGTQGFGFSLCTINDFDGDQVPELAIGAYGASVSGFSNSGTVHIIQFTANFLPKSVITVLAHGSHGLSLGSGMYFGRSLHSYELPDPKDGTVQMLAVGATRPAAEYRGSVFLITLRLDGGVALQNTVVGASAPLSVPSNTHFGESISRLPDASLAATGEYLLAVAAHGTSTLYILKLNSTSGALISHTQYAMAQLASEITTYDFGRLSFRDSLNTPLVGAALSSGGLFRLTLSSLASNGLQLRKIDPDSDAVLSLPRNSGFGSSIALLPDLNGDGIRNEFLVGAASRENSAFIAEGGAYILQTTADRQSIASVKDIAVGQVPSTARDEANFGQAVLSLPNVDSDPTTFEIAIGSPMYSVGVSTNIGAVVFMSLRSNGVSARTTKVLLHDPVTLPLLGGERFGSALSVAHDANNDGVANDIVVGCPYYSVGGMQRVGRVLFLSLVWGATLNVTLVGAVTHGSGVLTLAQEDFFGYSIAQLDDLNGDGTRELAIGLPNHSVTFGQEGGVAILRFLPGSTTVTNVFKFENGVNGASFGSHGAFVGYALSRGPDLDGDGKGNELLVTARALLPDGTPFWIVHALFVTNSGNGLGPTVGINPPPTSGTMTGLYDHYGGGLATIGDYDGDGFHNEIAIGAPLSDSGAHNAGGFYIMQLWDARMCRAGMYFDSAWRRCLPCPVGRYCPLPGSTSPLSCPAVVNCTGGASFPIECRNSTVKPAVWIKRHGRLIPAADSVPQEETVTLRIDAPCVLLDGGTRSTSVPVFQVGSHNLVLPTAVDDHGEWFEFNSVPGSGSAALKIWNQHGVAVSFFGLNITYQPPIIDHVSVERHGSNYSITVSGRYFLADVAQVSSLYVGGHLCTSPEFRFGSITCPRVPPGLAEPLRVQMNLISGQVVESSLFTLETSIVPTIARISPSIIFFDSSPNPQPLVLEIFGSDFGTRLSDITDARVGAELCDAVVWSNRSWITCRINRLSDSRGGARGVSLSVAGTPSVYQGLSTPSLLVLAPRAILGVLAPDIVPARGGVNISIVGTSLVEESEHPIVQIRVGGKPCPWIGVDGDKLVCTVPAGTGANRGVMLITSSGLFQAVAFDAVSYQKPILTHLTPNYAVRAPNTSFSFVVQGANFGVPDPTLLPTMTVGGLSCGRYVHHNDTVFECLDVVGLWSTMEVVVTIDGQTTMSNDLFQYLDPPSVDSVTPSIIPTTGKVVLSVVGAGFGLQPADVVAVTVGDTMCLSWTLIDDNHLNCTAPPGVGKDLSVTVSTNANGQSQATLLFSYEAPLIRSVTRAPMGVRYAMVGEQSIDLLINVTNAGTQLAKFSSVELTQAHLKSTCLQVNVVDRDPVTNEIVAIACKGVSLAAFAVSGGVAIVQFSVASQVATSQDLASLTLIGTPQVQLVTPNVVPTTMYGNATAGAVAVLGTGFGMRSEDVLNVYVDEVACPFVEYRSPTELYVTIPPGVGAQRLVTVRTRGGLQSPWSSRALLRCSTPTISAVTPAYLMRAMEPRLTVTGANFGNRLADVLGLTVGNVPCGSVTFVDDATLHCNDFDGASSLMTDTVVRVVVGGIAGASTSQVLERLGDPVVEQVVPSPAAPGDRITITGSNFGYQATDVLSVTVNGVTCTGLQISRPTSMSCLMPSPTDQVQAAAQTDPSVLLNQPLVVMVRGGVPSLTFSVDFRGGGFLPTGVPSHVLGWRTANAPQSVTVRWTYPKGTDITSFQVRTESVEPAGEVFLSNEFGTGSTELVTSPLTDVNVYRVDVTTLTNYAVLVRVRSKNEAGMGAWSVGSVAVPSCASDRYLATYRPLAVQSCVGCPHGAYCGGGSADNVTALEGFWRVPWSPGSIGFQLCPIPSSCLGHSARGGLSNHTLQHTTPADELEAALLREAPVAPAVSSPALEEGCAGGYSGVLCTDCVAGYTRWGKYECRQCQDRILVGLAAAGVVLLVLALIGYLTFNAVRASLQDDVKMDVAAIKIAFSFLQTVSIASTYDLRWPDAVRQLFGVMESVTSLSSEVLSLDCILQSASQRPSWVPYGSFFLARMVIMLGMPVLLVLVTAVFWFCIAPLCGRVIDFVSDARANREMHLAHAISRPSIDLGRLTDKHLARDSKQAVRSQVVNPMHTRADDTTTTAVSAGGGSKRSKRSSMFRVQVFKHQSGTSRIRSMVLGEHSDAVILTVWDRMVLTVVVTLFMVHMSVTKASLQLLTCSRLEHLGDSATTADGALLPPGASQGCSAQQAVSRLAGDMELCCQDPKVSQFTTAVGIPAVILYALGIPLTAAALLVCNRNYLHHKRVRASLGFLYTGYRPETFYWETVVMFRKAIVAAIAVFLAPLGAAIQTYASIVLVFVLAVLQVVFQPFRFATLNRLELGSLVTAFVTFECGLFLTDPNSSELVQTLATVGIFVVNIVTSVALVLVVCSSSRAGKAAAALLGKRTGD